MSGKAYGYITLLVGYIITGVGIYYLSYATGSHDCSPYGNYFNECRNIGTDAAPKFARSRYIPDPSGKMMDPDNSIKYILQEDTSACPKQDCEVGPWTKDGAIYKGTDNKDMQKWKRTIEKTPVNGGTPCPNVTAVTIKDGYPAEPFRFSRKPVRKFLGIERNENYIGGIIGIVIGSIFIVVGHALVFTTKN
jgi:hypothetical protein